MSDIKQFLDEWLPKTEEWNNVAKFIIDSGVELSDDLNPKWLTGYTNIGRSVKPHHKNPYVRGMEENFFVLHDCIHQIFTLEPNCSEEEYVERQIIGELFTFYLVEYLIPTQTDLLDRHANYIDDIRGNYWLMYDLMLSKPDDCNIIDWMWAVFIEDKFLLTHNQELLVKYRKMFKEDLHNSKQNYKFIKDLNIKSFCIVGASSENHLDFFEAVKKGAVKNIKREFNLILPEQWI